VVFLLFRLALILLPSLVAYAGIANVHTALAALPKPTGAKLNIFFVDN
jgi:hypothetical protein